MKKTGAALALFVSAVLLITWSAAFAATDGFYWLYEAAPLGTAPMPTEPKRLAPTTTTPTATSPA
ncbi:MAG: hypothetical protein A2075_19380 [Geobacteraceae bacterium GWC2_58_44]|nr:MAG: hypothetical protein A2075_19380 [Geobacteraceae bacterium GWC2_58_44]